MSHLITTKNKESGSALLLVVFMTILLAIIVSEVGFSSQTSFSLAQTQIDKLRMESASDSGFAYALNIIRSENNSNVVVNNEERENDLTNEAPADTATAVNASPFSQASTDRNSVSAPIDDTMPPATWTSGLPTITINNVTLKMGISLEEGKININRLVDDDDNVDQRIRSALLVLLEPYGGSEENLNRIIDYIDKNNLGNYESGAKNGPASSISEILKIQGITLKFTKESELETEGFSTSSTPLTQENLVDGKAEITLADLITVKSVGRLNINYSMSDTLKALLNGKDEGSLAGAILQQRTQQPIKSLNELTIDNNFKKGFTKLANYITTNETTFKVNLILKGKNKDTSNCYLGYIYKGDSNRAFYIYRTERFASDDIEFHHMEKSLESSDEEMEVLE